MVKDLFKNSRALLMRRQTNILSAAFVIMVAYATSGILGLLRNRLLAAAFFGGRESQLDAYFAAFVIPDTIFQMLITGALSAAFIPIYSKYLKQGLNEASRLASITINIISLIFIFIIGIGFLFSTQLSQLIAPSLDPQNLILLSKLLKIFLIAQIFFALSGFLTAMIQSQQRFLVPAVAPIVYNLGIILGIIFFSSEFGIFGPAIGVLIGSLFHFLIQLPLASKLGFRYRLSLDFDHPGVIQILKLMPPRSLTLAVSQIERFIAVMIATSLAAGSLTIFNFARQLYLLPVTLFGTTIGQAAFPALSQELALEKQEEFKQTLKSSLLQILYFALPAAAILLILRVPVVRIAFGARNFPWKATLLTGKTVGFLSLAIPTLSINAVLTRAYYAMHDTKTPLVVSSIGALITVVLSLFLTQILDLGVIGLAIALAVTNLIQALVLSLLLNKSVNILTQDFLFSGLKIFLASLATGVFLWIPMRVIDRFILDTTRSIDLLILTVSVLSIGMIVYLNLSAILKIEQLSEVIALGRRIGNWKNILQKSDAMLEATSLDKQTA